MKRLWFMIGIACRAFLIGFVLVVIASFFLPYYMSLPTEFVDLPGEQARSRMELRWPDSIPPSDVELMSGRIYSAIDSYVGWYRIVLKPDNAAKWQDEVHGRLEDASHTGSGFKIVEGVHRTVTNPVLPLNPRPVNDDIRQPKWWSLPPNEFRVTERMRWYDSKDSGHGNDSGYGDAVYSTFDPATNTLWMYAQSCQHCLFWSPGQVPEGLQFTVPLNRENDRTVPPPDVSLEPHPDPAPVGNPPGQTSPDLAK